MSAISYANKTDKGSQATVRPQSDFNSEFIGKFESILCEKLEGIEEKTAFKTLMSICAGCLAVMVFDILSNGALMDLLVTL